MASISGKTEAEIAAMLAGEGLMPMPAWSPEEFYTGSMAAPVGLGVQGTKNNRGSVPSADNSLSEPWPGAYNQTVYRNSNTGRDIIRNVPAPAIQTAQSTIDAATPFDINHLGLTTSPFKKVTPAETAIAEILVQGGMRAPTGGANRGRPAAAGKRLVWETAAPAGPAPAGDPWGGLRVDPLVTQAPGMVTGAREGGGSPAAVLHDRLSGEAQRQALQAQAQITSDPALAAAMAAGKTAYVSPTNNGVLADNALMPTVAMNGNPIKHR